MSHHMLSACAWNCIASFSHTDCLAFTNVLTHVNQKASPNGETVFVKRFSIFNQRVAFKPLVWHKPFLYRIQCVYIVIPSQWKTNDHRMCRDVLCTSTNLTLLSFGQVLCTFGKHNFVAHGVTFSGMDVVPDDAAPPGKPRCCKRLYKSLSLNFTAIFCSRVRFRFSTFTSRVSFLASCFTLSRCSRKFRSLAINGSFCPWPLFCFGQLLVPLALRQPHASRPRGGGFR